MESNKASERGKLDRDEVLRRLRERMEQWKLEEPEEAALDAEIKRAIRARNPIASMSTSTPCTMESNKVSERRKVSREEVMIAIKRNLDAEFECAIHARTAHASPLTLTPRTFLFLGCLPMPLPSVVQQEVLLMVPTFFHKFMGWENWKAAPATKPIGSTGPKAKEFVVEYRKTIYMYGSRYL